MRSRPLLCALVVALVASGCGARLTDEQRLAGIGALGPGAGAGGGPGAAPGATVPGATDPGATVPGAGPGAGGTAGPTAPGRGPGGGPAPKAPPGGNGGATDRGVTATQITVATASDVSGVQPGLFKSTHQAMSALAAYVNSQGGIYGRQIKPLLLDTRTDAVANRAAVDEACAKAFALVGSMSAFDDGGASKGEQCGIPDISAITVNGRRTLAKNVHPAYPVHPNYFMVGTANYIKEKFPNVIKKAAFLWLNAGAAPSAAAQRIKGYESVGFRFIYKQEVQVLEANYTPFVLEMQDRGVEHVGFVGDYQSITRLLKAMKQQGWFPTVRDWDSVAYSNAFLAQGKDATNGSLVFLNTAIFEEAARNPEMQLYQQWLARVAPGARADYFGLYAWSAGRLFQQAAVAAGPRLTRAKLLQALRDTHAWDGHGLHGAHDIGRKLPTHCFLYLEVKAERFVRRDPASGWMCNKGRLIRT